MDIATVTLESLSPYSQSRRLPPKESKDSWEDYEANTWHKRLHSTPDGYILIPPMTFKRSLESAAAFLSQRIPGKNRATYTKHFLAGILVTEGIKLPIKVEKCEFEDLPLSSRGQKGEMDIVKRMPVIRNWEGTVTYYILDATIKRDVFEEHLREAGNFIGIGRFRPQNGGFYGRYRIKEGTTIKWSESAGGSSSSKKSSKSKDADADAAANDTAAE